MRSPVSCPSCAAENPTGFAFCGYCGASLVPPGIAEERKVVTMLFCDLVGYTAHSEAADHELIDALLQRYNVARAELVESPRRRRREVHRRRRARGLRLSRGAR